MLQAQQTFDSNICLFVLNDSKFDRSKRTKDMNCANGMRLNALLEQYDGILNATQAIRAVVLPLFLPLTSLARCQRFAP